MAKVDDVKGPFGDNATVTDVTLFTCDTTARNAALPVYLAGQFVRIRPIGANLFFFFSSSTSATVDRTVAASATGATSTHLGEYVPNGELFHCVVPAIGGPGGNQPIFFVWQCDAAGTSVEITKASGVPGSAQIDR